MAFEYVSNMDVELNATIDSIKNPISGKISVPEIRTLIINSNKVDHAKTEIVCSNIIQKVDHSDTHQQPKD